MSRGAEKASSSVTITVMPAPVHAPVVEVTDASHTPIEGATVLFIGPFKERIEATTGSEGKATLPGLPDGTDAVYAYDTGYQPAVGHLTVSGGTGETTIALTSGAIGATTLKSHEMSLKEIEEAGINVNDPANQNVYEFEVRLAFLPEPAENVTLHCYINKAGEFVGACTGGGGGGGGGGWGGWGGGGGGGPGGPGCSPHECVGGGIVVIPRIVEKHPVIQWLILRGKATFLKQFFDVTQIVQNLSPEPFKFAPGTATLNIPSGMSLAPTATPQTATQSVPAIDGNSSAETNWIVRGDKPGFYLLSANYHSKLEPFEAPVEFEAQLATPLHIWGVEALELHVKAEEGFLAEGRPYHVTVTVTNKSEITLNNVDIEIFANVKENFDFQPDQRFGEKVAELKPNQTVAAPTDILVPDAASEFPFNPNLSSVHFVGEEIHPGVGIEKVASVPVYSISAPTDTSGQVHLHWQPSPGAEGYEVFATSDLVIPFAATPNEVFASPSSKTGVTELPASATDAYIPGTGTEEFWAVTSIIGGEPVLNHTVIKAAPGTGEEPPKTQAFQVTEGGRTFASALPSTAVATYTWLPHSKTVQWWETAKGGSKLKQEVEKQPEISFGSSKAGVRTLNVNATPEPGAQTIDGFGGALTDSAAYLIKHSPKQTEILQDLFGSAGAGFNLVRLPLGASDFIARPFPKEGCSPLWPECYEPNPLCFTSKLSKELQEGECYGSYADKKGPEQDPLENFSIKNDEANTIPVLEGAKGEEPNLRILATPWSGPGWMKVSGKYLNAAKTCKTGRNDFIGQFSDVIYAHYLALAAKRYEEKGLPFSILSIQNEPQQCSEGYPTMEMEAPEEAAIANSLYTQLRSKAIGVKHPPKLLGWDHNWVECGKKGPAKYPEDVLKLAPKAIALIGFHSYCNGLPYKPTFKAGFYVTESTGTYGKTELEEQAKNQHLEGESGNNLNYEVQHEIMDPIRDGAKASLYWNLALDEGCGPQFTGGEVCRKGIPAGCGNCRPMLTLNDEKGTVVKNEDYYYWEQFSKFVPRNSKYLYSKPVGSLDTAAFKAPSGAIVLVVLNK